LSVACIDEWRNRDGSSALGGTCLNAGCIPSKVLLESTALLHRAQHEFAAHGIKADGITVDLAAMQKRRATIVRGMTQGIAGLFKAAGFTALAGHGRLLAAGRVEYTAHDGSKRELAARHVVLASGSVPVELKSLPFDGRHIIDSWGALELEAIPQRLGVIGAGVIGLELGSVWRRLGAKVTVVEYAPTILPGNDDDIVKEADRIFRKQGLEIHVGTKVTGADVRAYGVTLHIEKDGATSSISGDYVLVRVGRKPSLRGIDTAALGLALAGRGEIAVNDQMRTNLPNVFAIGDAVGGKLLAHKAEDEGVIAAEVIAGKPVHMH